MASFCQNCGSQLGAAAFCGHCGARAAQQPAAPPVASTQPNIPAVTPAAKSSSAATLLKVGIILVAVVLVFGAVAIGGMYYVGHRLVRNVERATGQEPGTLVDSLRSAAASAAKSEHSPQRKRDGCLLLSKEEAAVILGVTIEKIDGASTQRDSGEHCEYFVKPETAEESAAKLKRGMEDIQARKTDAKLDGSVNMNAEMRKAGIENLIKGIGRAGASTSPDAPYFSFTIDREDGAIQFGAVKAANILAGAEAMKATESLHGLGDKAVLGPLDAQLCVLTGTTSILLDLSQVPDGREKGIAMARAILARL